MTTDQNPSEFPTAETPRPPVSPAPPVTAGPFPPSYAPAYPPSPYTYAQSYQTPAQNVNVQVMQATRPPLNGMAVASMILGIVGALLGYCLFAIPCVLAVVLGHVALVQVKRTGDRGYGMAVTGLILGYAALGILAAIFLFTVIMTGLGAAA